MSTENELTKTNEEDTQGQTKTPSLLDALLSKAYIKENNVNARHALGTIIREYDKRRKQGIEDEKINGNFVNQLIADIDSALGKQMDEILHDQNFQALESSWRGLKFVVDRTNFLKNNRLTLLNISKKELIDDFEIEADGDVLASGLYHHVYKFDYGTYGGEPFGGIIGNYDFSPSSPDMVLLENIASISAMSHAPFIAAASAEFFAAGEPDFGFPDLNNLPAGILQNRLKKQTKWQGFRSSEDARYVGLTAPRFLLRLPYDEKENPVKSFQYSESTSESHEDMLWGNTAFAFVTRLTESFANYGWCPSIIGPKSGGQVEGLKVPNIKALDGLEQKIPTELIIPERLDYELSEEGFIPLVIKKGTDNACFFAANSTQKTKTYQDDEDGFASAESYTLGTRLPYMYMVCRVAHYIKVLQREEIGSSKSASEIASEMNKWIKQYVSDMENPDSNTRAKKPFRKAQILVEAIRGQPGHFKVGIKLVPHFKLEGLDVTLSLVGNLD